ncbi:SGNH/GDSL hydrolase family protein [Shewanella baltica]|uniref:SGNH/GDSL hydrolase family protein n=1 Tax=Shewanella baltica TaxID=62322 RepID=UPI00216747CF|nr:SGNH/GDSL hydrolase family protein [Shewanella baltica]MCS6113015.1 SGNH/GDSL hydrolase family protein [Shewanella baltica]UVW64276.1 SGNH/GDSL hydrolase family protein [Shewanella baltica]
MHPLRNGSQSAERPAAKPVSGSPGWFTESGDSNKPSYPGQDWFNQNIAEFKNALAETGVTFDPNRDDHLQQSFAFVNSKFVDVNKSLFIAINTLESYEVVDSVPAMIDSMNQNGYIYFPGNKTETAIYNIVGDHPELYGATIYVDNNVMLSFNYDYYDFIGSLNIIGECTCEIAEKNFTFKTNNISDYHKDVNVNNSPQTIEIVKFLDCKVMNVDGDVYTEASMGSTSPSAALFSVSQTTPTAFFAPIDIGESISAHLKMQIGTTGKIGVILRCEGGWIKLFQNSADLGAWKYQVKPTGQAIITNVDVNTPDNNLLSYAAKHASFGISLESRSAFSLIINGCSGGAPLISQVGDIYEVGFFCEDNSAGAVARITGLCSYKSKAGIFGKAPLHLLIHGDSTGAKWLSSFDRYLKQAFDGVNGCRTLEITNKAVAGETFRQQLDRLKVAGPGQAYIIIMVAGTNEGQGNTPADDFAAMVQEFIDYCTGLFRVPMLVEPWMWYPSSKIGNSGQASSNYEKVSELREAGKRVAIANGVPFVSTTHSLPAPLPAYFNSGLDPLLRDDIHQSFLTQQLYAERIASEIARWWFSVDSKPRSVPQYLAESNVVISESSFSGKSVVANLSVTSFANSQNLLELPRWCRPDRQMSWPAVYTKPDGTYSSCRILYQNGYLRADGLDLTTAVIVVNICWQN